ncbi:MAG: flagellar type III secretion system pore protein FliP [Phycisphaerae bacterium]|nr:flagellar type III secretion system pore protein FliP [Phycisphaerae bacterium]
MRIAALLVALLLGVASAHAQPLGPPTPGPPAPAAPAPDPLRIDGLNPVMALEAAGRAMEGLSGSGSPSAPGDERRPMSGPVAILLLLTVITLVPSIMLMTTCFVRFTVVLGLLKQAMGTQTIPPPQVLVALSLFMTLLVMAPTIERIHAEAVAPYQRGEITDSGQVWERAKQPLRDYMFDQIEASDNWSSLYMVLNYRGVDTSDPSKLARADVDMVSLIPAYMLSELKIAFLMGFKLYLPFLVIDMVISSLLISMGMMMLPPVLISLPFKVLLFVLVDGWQLVVGSLMTSVSSGRAVETAMLIHSAAPPGVLG